MSDVAAPRLVDLPREVDPNPARLDTVDVVLEGGPVDFPEAQRVRQAQAIDRKIKINHRNGYEHFERTGESRHRDGSRVEVYRWTTRTSIAE